MTISITFTLTINNKEKTLHLNKKNKKKNVKTKFTSKLTTRNELKYIQDEAKTEHI